MNLLTSANKLFVKPVVFKIFWVMAPLLTNIITEVE